MYLNFIINNEKYEIYISKELMSLFNDRYGNNIIPFVKDFEYKTIVYKSINLSKIDMITIKPFFEKEQDIVSIDAINTNILNLLQDNLIYDDLVYLKYCG